MKLESIVFITILFSSSILCDTIQPQINQNIISNDIKNTIEEYYQLATKYYIFLLSYYLVEVEAFLHYFLPLICFLVILSYFGLIGKKMNIKKRKGSFNISDNEEDKLLKNSL